ncbi:MAG: hypothetical protein HY901_24335 [Deltaproteobacteria bacterium]|nr:hypothetical protein [Deltaproteobacteria bacterium]
MIGASPGAKGASGRAGFGPPRAAVGAFFWSALQLPRALLWQLRDGELRSLAVLPFLVTFLAGAATTSGAVLGAGPLQEQLMTRGEGVLGGVAWLAARALLTIVLLSAAGLATWHLQGFIASAFLERMALHVQRLVDGEAPAPATGALEVLGNAALGVFPRLKGLVAWGLSAMAASTLILVPGFGPVLVVAAQTAIGALFLAHGAIADNRARLGLPRRLLLREPAMVLGLALALAPLLVVPPLLLFSGGPVAIAGALVALGAQRRRRCRDELRSADVRGEAA